MWKTDQYGSRSLSLLRRTSRGNDSNAAVGFTATAYDSKPKEFD
jgi:hypothetical protein